VKLVLPLYLVVGKKKPKKLPLNLNHYRNAHFHVLNSMKVQFKQAISSQLTFPKLVEPVKISYVLYPATHRELDISNVLCIVDKYLCDALVEAGLMEDDNFNHLPQVEFRFGAVDKENPRAEAFIQPVQKSSENSMQITINQTQIEKAIQDFMLKRINIKEGTEIKIEMKATRGAEGFSAVIDIIDDLDAHNAMLEQEKARQTSAKEEKLEKAGRFLDRVKTKKSEPEPESEIEDPEEEDQPSEESCADADEADEPKEPEESVDAEEAPKPAKAKSIFGNKVTPN